MGFFDLFFNLFEEERIIILAFPWFVLIFAAIGHNTINEIFQLFTAFLVAVQCNQAILVTNLREKKKHEFKMTK